MTRKLSRNGSFNPGWSSNSTHQVDPPIDWQTPKVLVTKGKRLQGEEPSTEQGQESVVKQVTQFL